MQERRKAKRSRV